MTTEQNIVRHMLALSDQDLLELEAAIQKEKQARHDCSHGLRFPELAAVVITCAPGLDTPDVRSHISPLPSTAEFFGMQDAGPHPDPKTAPGTAAHRDMVATAMQLASVAGKAAYERGLPKIPSFDAAFMEFLRAHLDGPRGRFIQAWNEAWSTGWYAAAKTAESSLHAG